MWKSEKSFFREFIIAKIATSKGFNFVSSTQNVFCVNPRLIRRKWKLNWKLEKHFFPTHRMIVNVEGQLRSDFQSKPIFHEKASASINRFFRLCSSKAPSHRRFLFPGIFRFSWLFTFEFFCRSRKLNKSWFSGWRGRWCRQRWRSANDGRHRLGRSWLKRHVEA